MSRKKKRADSGIQLAVDKVIELGLDPTRADVEDEIGQSLDEAGVEEFHTAMRFRGYDLVTVEYPDGSGEEVKWVRGAD